MRDVAKTSVRLDAAVDKNVEMNKPTIAYAVSITGCDDKDRLFTAAHGAAVLAHSIRKVSAENRGGLGYPHKMIAFIHPDAARCSEDDLTELGYEVMIRDTPVAVSDIKGKYLRENIASTGCCGERELVKLYAYTLTEYPIVVHLDLDVLILKPIDEMFDSMLYGPESPSRQMVQVQFGQPMPRIIDAYFARDYMGVYWGGRKPVGVHGGFFVVRPSKAAFQELVDVVRQGDYTPESGWARTGHGRCHGGETIQGLLPYYYDILHPGTAVELNRCIYNVVADNPRDREGNCIAGVDPTSKSCEDCREASMDQIKVAHFTYCQKPWLCRNLDGPVNFTSDNQTDRSAIRLCIEMQREWFLMRKDLDKSFPTFHESAINDHQRDKQMKKGMFKPDQFQGYCREFGKKGYIPFDSSVLNK
uniref:Nucleotide-diphospho-sugar transferase domain-containing protein n=1 Tax=Pseudictyota dubia TaxID=2749911 RepID=A0A7R9W8A3_9STRA